MKRNTQVAAGVLFLLKHFSFYLFVESLKKANSRNGKEQIVLLLQPGFSLSPSPLISSTPWPGLPSSSNSVSLLPSLVLVPSFLFSHPQVALCIQMFTQLLGFSLSSILFLLSFPPSLLLLFLLLVLQPFLPTLNALYLLTHAAGNWGTGETSLLSLLLDASHPHTLVRIPLTTHAHSHPLNEPSHPLSHPLSHLLRHTHDQPHPRTHAETCFLLIIYFFLSQFSFSVILLCFMYTETITHTTILLLLGFLYFAFIIMIIICHNF